MPNTTGAAATKNPAARLTSENRSSVTPGNSVVVVVALMTAATTTKPVEIFVAQLSLDVQAPAPRMGRWSQSVQLGMPCSDLLSLRRMSQTERRKESKVM